MRCSELDPAALGDARCDDDATDEQASAEAVQAAIAKAATGLASGDVFLLTYSGHGSQVPDKNGDESDDGEDDGPFEHLKLPFGPGGGAGRRRRSL